MADSDPKAEGKKKALAVMAALESVDKPPTKSKKFMALMFFEISWKLLIGYGIYVELDSSVLLAMVTAAGAVEGVGNWVQGKHDETVKTAKLAAMNGNVSKAIEESS